MGEEDGAGDCPGEQYLQEVRVERCCGKHGKSQTLTTSLVIKEPRTSPREATGEFEGQGSFTASVSSHQTMLQDERRRTGITISLIQDNRTLRSMLLEYEYLKQLLLDMLLLLSCRPPSCLYDPCLSLTVCRSMLQRVSVSVSLQQNTEVHILYLCEHRVLVRRQDSLHI